VLTAPAGFEPSVTIRNGNTDTVKTLPADDAFKKSIEHFMKCVISEKEREENYRKIIKQAELVDEFKMMATS
jgi:hypothetical protein